MYLLLVVVVVLEISFLFLHMILLSHFIKFYSKYDFEYKARCNSFKTTALLHAKGNKTNQDCKVNH